MFEVVGELLDGFNELLLLVEELSFLLLPLPGLLTLLGAEVVLEVV